MLIHFDTDRLNDYSLTAGDVLIVLAEVLDVNLEETAKELLRVYEADTSLLGNFGIETRPILKERVAALMQDSTPTKVSEDDLLECAKRLKEVYPKGCIVGKTGTKYPYAESPLLIVRRLKLFFRKYGEFPLDRIVKATQRYVHDERENPMFKTLKYFICQERVVDGMVESESKLLNYLEIPDDMEGTHSDEEFVTLV